VETNPIDLTQLHVLALAVGEARIALLEALEDLLMPIVRWLSRVLP